MYRRAIELYARTLAFGHARVHLEPKIRGADLSFIILFLVWVKVIL